MLHRSPLLVRRLQPVLRGGGGIKRFESSSSSSSTTTTKKKLAVAAASGADEKRQLKWTEREEAPGWLRKMAPTRGGTALPTGKEAAVIAVVAAAFYYSWFVEPPKRDNEH